MARDTVVLPTTRIPRRLWLRLKEMMKNKIFTSKTELIKEALRECAALHKQEKAKCEFSLIDASITLEEGRAEDKRRAASVDRETTHWTAS